MFPVKTRGATRGGIQCLKPPATRSTIQQSDGPRCCQTAAIITWQIEPGLPGVLGLVAGFVYTSAERSDRNLDGICHLAEIAVQSEAPRGTLDIPSLLYSLPSSLSLPLPLSSLSLPPSTPSLYSIHPFPSLPPLLPSLLSNLDLHV